MDRKANITFAVPAYGMMAPEVAVSLAQAFGYVVSKGLEASIATMKEPSVTRARNDLVREILERYNPTHIMWVDSDIVLPQDAVIRLLMVSQAVAGGLYHYKVPPFAPVVYDLDPYCRRDYLKSDGPHPVDGMGMGCVLIWAHVFQKMQVAYGDQFWFKETEEEGEDVWFYRRLKELQIWPYLDPTVKCGHVRQQIITSADWIV